MFASFAVENLIREMPSFGISDQAKAVTTLRNTSLKEDKVKAMSSIFLN
jgi:hypothetical protein